MKIIGVKNMAKASTVKELNVDRPGSSAALPPPAQAEPPFRFSGHQTFPLRITWIPKAVAEITAGHDPLTDIDEGITQLGLGKNMVEALRCWMEAFQIAKKTEKGWALTPIGSLVFDPADGFDPYHEDVSTSWLLHWLISTNTESPFFAWECLFNRWPATEFSASQVVDAFQKETSKTPRPASIVTVRQHWEVFLHSYRRPPADKGEDHLDSAMSVLRLIQEFGERPNASGKWEKLYSFDLSRKQAIPEQLFAFFLHDWWNRNFPNERTTPLREIVMGEHSPGRMLKMQESEIIQRVIDLAARQPKVFQIVESTNLRQLHRLQRSDGLSDLKAAYRAPRFI
ncbi:MAG: DUF4007 family protein [Acidobacteriia bacterium]|nr:DUF4007 family protein [Terriglobia bacterium]